MVFPNFLYDHRVPDRSRWVQEAGKITFSAKSEKNMRLQDQKKHHYAKIQKTLGKLQILHEWGILKTKSRSEATNLHHFFSWLQIRSQKYTLQGHMASYEESGFFKKSVFFCICFPFGLASKKKLTKTMECYSFSHFSCFFFCLSLGIDFNHFGHRFWKDFGTDFWYFHRSKTC